MLSTAFTWFLALHNYEVQTMALSLVTSGYVYVILTDLMQIVNLRCEFYRCWCCFFFSSRRRHTRYWRDWSSDVCSSDLGLHRGGVARRAARVGARPRPGVP